MSSHDGSGGAGGEVIVAENLVKVFHTLSRRPGFVGGLASLVAPRRVAHTAVNGVTLTVRRGELLALLGPNGAGKSTTIKMLTGIVAPSVGRVRVAGLDPHRDRERNARNIGAVFGQRTQLWWDLPVRDSLSILRDIFGVSRADYQVRLRELEKLLGLSEFLGNRVRHLSLGQRVRADLAAALLHDPAIIYLDEPTIGMDVVVKEQVREFLRYQVEQRGRTILLTTHDMTEVSRLARRVALINHGRLAFDGPLDDLRASLGNSWQVRVTLAEPEDAIDVPGVQLVRRDGPLAVFGPVEARGSGAGTGPEAVTSPREALRRIIDRHAVTDVAIEESDLEDVMRQAYQRGAREAETVPA